MSWRWWVLIAVGIWLGVDALIVLGLWLNAAWRERHL